MLGNGLATSGRSRERRLPCLMKIRSAKWFILMTVTFAMFTDIFLYGVMVPVLPFALESRVGVPTGDVQRWTSIMLAVYAAGLLAFSPVWGYFADHTKSRRLPFMIGLLTLSGATAVLCISSSLAVVAIGRTLQGISAALVWVVGLTIVSDTVGGDKLGEAMGWVTMGVAVAIFVGPMLGGIVFAKAGYYAVFGMAFGLLAVDVVLRLSMIEAKVAAEYSTNSEDTAETGLPYREDVKTEGAPIDIPQVSSESQITRRRLPSAITLLRSPRLLSALFGSFVQAILYTSFDGVIPLFVNRTFGWDSFGAGIIFLCLCIPAFLEPMIGAISDRCGVRCLATAGFSIALPFFVLLRLVTYDSLGQKVLLCALLVFLGFSFCLVISPLLAEITRTVEDKEKESPGVFGKRGAYAQAYALFNMAFAGGSLIGPIWAGFVVQTAGWGTMGWSLGLLSLFTAIPVFIWSGGRFKFKQNSAQGDRVTTAHEEDV